MNVKKLFYFILFSFVVLSCPILAQTQLSVSGKVVPPDHFIDSLLHSRPDLFRKILKNIDKYEVQIIYTKIDRSKKNEPSFTHYTYRLGKDYFYPASLVKLPASLLALEKANRLGIPRNTIMLTDSSKACPFAVRSDTTSENKKPSLEHYIKRMMLVSDNFSYNRVYEFVGQEELNNQLKNKGYINSRIVHSFDGGCPDGKHTNGISFVNEKGDTIYRQDTLPNIGKYDHPLGTVKKGRAHLDHRDKYVKAPKDFTYMNYLPLEDVHSMVMTVMFPEAMPKEKRFHITETDYAFMRKYMSMLPRESGFPKYDPKKYEDSHKKYLLFGTYHDKINTDNIRIFNIVGQSYGNLIDCAYIVDLQHNIEFFLSASIYVNSDGVINDGKYDYKTVGFPFLADLGKVFLEHERNREREHAPDLSGYKFK